MQNFLNELNFKRKQVQCAIFISFLMHSNNHTANSVNGNLSTLLSLQLHVQTKFLAGTSNSHLRPQQLCERAFDRFRRIARSLHERAPYTTMAEFNPPNFHEFPAVSSRGEDVSSGYWLHRAKLSPANAAECPNPISRLYAAAKLNARSNLTGSKLPYRLSPSPSASTPEDPTNQGRTKERLDRKIYKIIPRSRNFVSLYS